MAGADSRGRARSASQYDRKTLQHHAAGHKGVHAREVTRAPLPVGASEQPPGAECAPWAVAVGSRPGGIAVAAEVLVSVILK
jgi:hypothetical protein